MLPTVLATPLLDSIWASNFHNFVKNHLYLTPRLILQLNIMYLKYLKISHFFCYKSCSYFKFIFQYISISSPKILSTRHFSLIAHTNHNHCATVPALLQLVFLQDPLQLLLLLFFLLVDCLDWFIDDCLHFALLFFLSLVLVKVQRFLLARFSAWEPMAHTFVAVTATGYLSQVCVCMWFWIYCQ